MKAQDVVDYVWSIAPNPEWGAENVYEWGSAQSDVTGIAVAWWITTDMLEEMARLGLNLGLTHEKTTYPLWTFRWGPLPPQDELRANRRIQALAERHAITVHRFHSNLDLADWGMPKALIAQLDWQDYPVDWSRGVPVVTLPPQALGEVVASVKARMGLPFVRYDGDPARVVSRIALAWGGLCQLWSPAACVSPLDPDVILGGDIIDGVVRFNREQGYATIDAMHHATEMAAMELLCDKLRKRFLDMAIHYFSNSMPWAVA